MIVVYTVITGEYDRLRPPAVVEPCVRYVCFSDRPQNVAPWECQPFPQCFGRNTRHNSRIPKMLPHLLLDCDYSIFHDGAFRMKAFPSALIVDWLQGFDVAALRHPENSNYEQEAKFYQRIHGYVPEEIQRQVSDFRARGYAPMGWWAGGIILRRHTDVVKTFNESWMAEYLKGSSNDQFSLLAAVRESGVRMGTVDREVLNCPEIGYHLHADSGCQDNVEFEPERDQWRQRVLRIWEACS